jgi:hypothetical protein
MSKIGWSPFLDLDTAPGRARLRRGPRKFPFPQAKSCSTSGHCGRSQEKMDPTAGRI